MKFWANCPMDIDLAGVWEYVGTEQPHCQQIAHKVISFDGKEVATWSQPLNFKRQTTMRAGDTWMGPTDDFLKNFKPAVSGKPFSFV